MTDMPDLGPAARIMTILLDGVTDDQLTAPTPCADYALGDLLDHVGVLASAFTATAAKQTLPGVGQGPSGDAARLPADWRTEFAGRLAALAEAWRAPAAWEGTVRFLGTDMPADIVGRIALNELVVHGWDVGRASGQSFDYPAETLDVCLGFMTQSATDDPEAAAKGPWGPRVPVPDDAPKLDRIIGLSGRDPAWRST